MKNEKSGFFDLPPGYYDLPGTKPCLDPAHEPPTHLYIPPGKGYRHVCRSCGNTRLLFSSAVTL